MSIQSFSLKVPTVNKQRWGKPKPGESLKMLAAGSLAFAKAYSSVEKLEHELEAEILREKENDPKKVKGIQKWRRNGRSFLLSKYMLLLIVVLNIIDCTLVLGELIMDLHHVKDIHFDTQQSTSNFLEQLKGFYPDKFEGLQPKHIGFVYNTILQSLILWRDASENETTLFTQCFLGVLQVKNSSIKDDISNLARDHSIVLNNKTCKFDNEVSENFVYFNQGKVASSEQHINDDEDDSILKMFGYVFHKFSLAISIMLVLWICLKIICFGRHLLDRRLEDSDSKYDFSSGTGDHRPKVFDAFVTLTSFIVDMIFVKGLSMYSLQDFVFIVAFMLPWRVIRVTNSLVVAVKDHEHFRLKLLFTQKKKIELDNKHIRADRDNYKEQVDALKKLCINEGIDEWKVFQSSAQQHVRPSGKSAMGSLASLAFGAFGSKSSSFWSIIGTPNMRRDKSMELIDHKVSIGDNKVQPEKRTGKGKFFGFLGSSADFFRGKHKNGHHLSLNSDPGLTSSFLKSNPPYQQNGHVSKRLVRGETIDTLSLDSYEELNDKSDDHLAVTKTETSLPKQDTADSSMLESFEVCSVSQNMEPVLIKRTHSESAATRPPLVHGVRIKEESSSSEQLKWVSLSFSGICNSADHVCK